MSRATLPGSVLHVVFFRSKKEMPWTNARRNVARMTDTLLARECAPMSKHVGKARGNKRLTPVTDLPIATPITPADPKPATVVNEHLFPETILKRSHAARVTLDMLPQEGPVFASTFNRTPLELCPSMMPGTV